MLGAGGCWGWRCAGVGVVLGGTKCADDKRSRSPDRLLLQSGATHGAYPLADPNPDPDPTHAGHYNDIRSFPFFFSSVYSLLL